MNSSRSRKRKNISYDTDLVQNEPISKKARYKKSTKSQKDGKTEVSTNNNLIAERNKNISAAMKEPKEQMTLNSNIDDELIDVVSTDSITDAYLCHVVEQSKTPSGIEKQSLAQIIKYSDSDDEEIDVVGVDIESDKTLLFTGNLLINAKPDNDSNNIVKSKTVKTALKRKTRAKIDSNLSRSKAKTKIKSKNLRKLSPAAANSENLSTSANEAIKSSFIAQEVNNFEGKLKDIGNLLDNKVISKKNRNANLSLQKNVLIDGSRSTKISESKLASNLDVSINKSEIKKNHIKSVTNTKENLNLKTKKNVQIKENKKTYTKRNVADKTVKGEIKSNANNMMLHTVKVVLDRNTVRDYFKAKQELRNASFPSSTKPSNEVNKVKTSANKTVQLRSNERCLKQQKQTTVFNYFNTTSEMATESTTNFNLSDTDNLDNKECSYNEYKNFTKYENISSASAEIKMDNENEKPVSNNILITNKSVLDEGTADAQNNFSATASGSQLANSVPINPKNHIVSRAKQPKLSYCDDCDYSTKKGKPAIRKHILLGCGSAAYLSCKFCPVRTRNREALAAHLRRRHADHVGGSSQLEVLLDEIVRKSMELNAESLKAAEEEKGVADTPISSKSGRLLKMPKFNVGRCQRSNSKSTL